MNTPRVYRAYERRRPSLTDRRYSVNAITEEIGHTAEFLFVIIHIATMVLAIMSFAFATPCLGLSGTVWAVAFFVLYLVGRIFGRQF